MTGARTRVALAAAALLASACAASHAGRTVGRGVIQGEVTVSGPLVTNLGPAVPIPNLPLGVRYGITDRLDFNTHLNVLPIVMGGFIAADAGITWAILHRERRSGPNLATGVSFMLVSDFHEEARLIPLADIAGGATFGPFTLFAGFDVMCDYWGGGANFSPFAGFEIDLPRRVILHGAFKWFAATFDVYDSPTRYVNVNHKGMMGFVIGIKFGFDLEERRRKKEAGDEG
jgi:hypothetical protein